MDLPIRHALATLAYRLGKVLHGTPPEFGDFAVAGSGRTPAQILAHIGDLMDWALTQVEGRQAWQNSQPLSWPQEIARFHQAIEKLDQRLTAQDPSAVTAEKLFQGAIADALTHTGQIALLRRMAGYPVRPENYSVAEIAAGRLGPEQAAPRREFD